MDATSRLRRLSLSLSGYLCGTHSGVLAYRRGERLDARGVAAAHRALGSPAASDRTVLGRRAWQPPGGTSRLRAGLRSALSAPGIMELILFGSQARGGTTGFSDVDAVLVLEDAAAENPATLRSLRRRVLAAQRAVMAYQPMQHHGFEVVTPKLLGDACAALELPPDTVNESRSLGGAGVPAAVHAGAGSSIAAARLSMIADRVRGLRAWPRHPWRAHVTIAMLELLPALYLQSKGRAVPKWRSFDEARVDFGDRWWPYDVLEEVRASWRREARPELQALIAVARNPWAAVAAWTRLPISFPPAATPLLSPRTLRALQGLALEMASRRA